MQFLGRSEALTLKLKTFSAIRWTLTSAGINGALQLAQIAILARLLNPEDYGLMAIVSAILGFATLFADFGINSAYIQRPNITLNERSSLFWLNILVSAFITLVVIAISPLCAWFFGDMRLTHLMMLSAVTLILGAFGHQIRLSAEKELNFRPVVISEICGAFFGFSASVLAALAGWGVYSLVVSGIVSTFSGTVLAWIFFAQGWRPAWRFRLKDVQPFLAFGGASVANNIVNLVNSSIDIFLGGRLLSATQLGLYSVPRNLSLQVQSLINPIITRVGFPLIAQVQSDTTRVRAIYLKTMNMTASANAPLYMGIAFFSPEIVNILLGAGWDRSADILRVLAFWGGLRSTGNPVGSLLFGMGRAGLALRWNLGISLIAPIVIWLGLLKGPEGMAWGLLLLQVVLFVPAWRLLIKPLCQARLVEYSTSALKPFLLAGLSIAPAFWVATYFEGSITRLVVGATIAAPLYLVTSIKGNPEFINSLAELIGNKKPSPQKT